MLSDSDDEFLFDDKKEYTLDELDDMDDKIYTVDKNNKFIEADGYELVLNPDE